MHIVVDATALPARAGGAGNYIIQLVAALRDLGTGDRFSVLAKPEDLERLGPWPAGRAFEPVAIRLTGRPHRLAWEQTGLVRLMHRLRGDALHSPHYTVPLRLSSAARVVTFHDMIFFLFPEHHTWTKRVFFQQMIRRSAHVADHIITDSDATRSDTIRLFHPSRPVTTVHLAPDVRYRPIDDPAALDAVRVRYGITRPFVLSVGTLEPRKNLVGALRALRLLRERGADVGLVVCGAEGWQVRSVFNEVSAQSLGGAVTFLGYVPNEDLPALYSACEVFLYPSFYEGFGLPPLEAMACGAAVVAGNRSSMPEIVADGGLLCAAEDPVDIAAALHRLLCDRSERDACRHRALARAAAFTWAETARRTYAVYQQAVAARTARG